MKPGNILTLIAEIVTVLSGSCSLISFMLSLRGIQVDLSLVFVVSLTLTIIVGFGAYNLGRDGRHG